MSLLYFTGLLTLYFISPTNICTNRKANTPKHLGLVKENQTVNTTKEETYMLEALPPSQPVSSSPLDSRLTVLDTANIYEEHFTSSMPICFPYMFLKLENKIYVFCLYTYGL